MRFLIACVTFVLAHICDYKLTVWGLENTFMEELNPLASLCIHMWGIELGLLVFKVLMVTVLLAATTIIPRKVALWVLYIGAYLTVFGSTLWLI